MCLTDVSSSRVSQYVCGARTRICGTLRRNSHMVCRQWRPEERVLQPRGVPSSGLRGPPISWPLLPPGSCAKSWPRSATIVSWSACTQSQPGCIACCLERHSLTCSTSQRYDHDTTQRYDITQRPAIRLDVDATFAQEYGACISQIGSIYRTISPAHHCDSHFVSTALCMNLGRKGLHCLSAG